MQLLKFKNTIEYFLKLYFNKTKTCFIGNNIYINKKIELLYLLLEKILKLLFIKV